MVFVAEKSPVGFAQFFQNFDRLIHRTFCFRESCEHNSVRIPFCFLKTSENTQDNVQFHKVEPFVSDINFIALLHIFFESLQIRLIRTQRNEDAFDLIREQILPYWLQIYFPQCSGGLPINGFISLLDCFILLHDHACHTGMHRLGPADSWHQLLSSHNVLFYPSLVDCQSRQMLSQLQHISMQRPQKIEGEKLIKPVYETAKITFTEKDQILYALGIGFNLDPLKQEDFKFTSEFDSDFSSFPTFASCLATAQNFRPLLENPHLPNFAVHQILHAEEKIFMVEKSLIAGQPYEISFQFIDAQSKGKNAFLTNRITIYRMVERKRQLACYIDRNIFIRGLGNFDFKGTGMSQVIPNAPKRKPDEVLVEKTFPNQAFFYRLNGDANPLHIDPNVAAIAGFQRPIIHGLASYGIVAKSITQRFLNNEPKNIQSYETRFIGHVFPGESLSTEVWKEGNKLFFLTSTVERKTKAISGVLTVREQAKL